MTFNTFSIFNFMKGVGRKGPKPCKGPNLALFC